MMHYDGTNHVKFSVTMATVDIEDDALTAILQQLEDRMIVGYDGTNIVRGESPTIHNNSSS